MEENNQNQTPQEEVSDKENGAKSSLYFYAIAIFAAVLIVSFLIYLRGRGQAASTENVLTPTVTLAPTESPTSELLLVGDNAIAVSDFTAGDKVTVAMVVLEKPGYVVIHEDDLGKPGKVIGKSELVASEEAKNIEIKLDRKSVDGEILYAMLHTDDGDGKYEFPGADEPIKDEEGNIVMMTFKVGSEVQSETKETITPAVNY